mgnify:FL=1
MLVRRNIKAESERVARDMLRRIRPTAPPSTFEVVYVATALRAFRAGRRMVAVPAFDRPVPAAGLDPAFRRQFEASARTGRRRG